MIRERSRPRRSLSWWKHLRQRRWFFRGIVAAIIVVVLLVVLFGATSIWPDLGAKGTAAMRVVLGDRITAKIEGIMLSASDWLHGVEYALGMGHDQNPLQTSGGDATGQRTPGAAPPATRAGSASSGSTSTVPSTGLGEAQMPSGTQTTLNPVQEPAASIQPPFALSPLTAMGSLDGEGQWQAFITDAYGRIVAYRTVLQPDRSRGYAHAVVVAVDLRNSRLHFVLGYEEPASSNKFDRPGAIPEQALQPGVLLAAFNGGFQAKHGQFGAMAGGQIALPARGGLGTLVLYKDGRVDIGAWGTDIQASPDMESWRQNGPLMVAHGVVNPHTADFAPKDWGYVFGGGVATFRSGVGISKDRETLYFVIGPSLTTSSLAAAMKQAGIWNGIQLDVNRPWTRFDKAVFTNGKLTIKPAVDGVAQADYRLFKPYKRDFFYITAGPPPTG